MCACGTFIPALSVKMEFSCTLSTAAWQITPAKLQKAESENSRSILQYTRSGQSTSPVLNSVQPGLADLNALPSPKRSYW